MELDELEREIIKVTKLGGTARVPEATVMESMDCPDEAECRTQMEEWLAELCLNYHLSRDQDKDMFGQAELLLTHIFSARTEASAD